MMGKLVRDESGIALGLAVIMIVLIGVMGAGLLVFVRNDLEAVVEMNQGQRAFDIADAGAQVAKQQILGDKIPAHYDVENTLHPDYIALACNTDANDPDDATDSANDIQRAPSGENWAPDSGGQMRTFANGQFTVTIRWLNQDPSVDLRCRAPETTSSPVPGVDFFKVVSTGTFGDATRRIETIYETYDLNVPRAYYTPGRIILDGSKVCINSVSLFSGHDSSDGNDAIQLVGSQGGCANGQKIDGPDLAYGDWNDPPSDKFNTTSRTGSACTRGGVTRTCAGLGAVGNINTVRNGLDYDNGALPTFVRAPTFEPQSSSEITFPFDLASQPDADRLCDEAKAQGNYVTDNTTSTSTDFPNTKLPAWPDPSSNQTVVCYEFTNIGNSHTLRWTVSGNETLVAPYADCKGPIRKGTLVIKNGGFSIKSGSNVALFRGVVVTRGPEATQNSEVGDANLAGNNCLDGFINSTGPITIRGAVTPASSQEANDRPGFYGVRTWSWRELYQ